MVPSAAAREVWKRYDKTEYAVNQAENPDYAFEPFQSGSVSADDSREHVFPGALVELRVGRGRLIVDARRWTTETEALRTLAERLAK